MNKAIARILLIILILAVAALACVGGDGDGGVTRDGAQLINSSTTQGLGSADATATYGAEQFHIQLTAIAQPEP